MTALLVELKVCAFIKNLRLMTRVPYNFIELHKKKELGILFREIIKKRDNKIMKSDCSNLI